MGSAEISYLSHFAPMNQPTHGWIMDGWMDGMIFQEQNAKSLQKYQGVWDGIMRNNDCILGSTLIGPVPVNVDGMKN